MFKIRMNVYLSPEPDDGKIGYGSIQFLSTEINLIVDDLHQAASVLERYAALGTEIAQENAQ